VKNLCYTLLYHLTSKLGYTSKHIYDLIFYHIKNIIKKHINKKDA